MDGLCGVKHFISPIAPAKYSSGRYLGKIPAVALIQTASRLFAVNFIEACTCWFVKLNIYNFEKSYRYLIIYIHVLL